MRRTQSKAVDSEDGGSRPCATRSSCRGKRLEGGKQLTLGEGYASVHYDFYRFDSFKDKSISIKKKKESLHPELM